MKRTFIIMAMAFAIALPAAAAGAVPVAVWDQDFQTGTDGWFDSDNGWFGSIEASGGVATVEGDEDSAPFSWFDGPRDTWPGAWTAEIDVVLDPGAWAAGTGFDYSVAASGSDGVHQRDYIFHVTQDASTGALLVAGSNNSDFASRTNLESGNHHIVDAAGWYTLQHVFYEDGGSLWVDLNLLDSAGNELFTETRAPRASEAMSEVGGNYYSWFTFVDVAGGITVDNHQLLLQGPETTDDCKKGGHDTFFGVYANQGECVSAVTTDGKNKNQ